MARAKKNAPKRAVKAVKKMPPRRTRKRAKTSAPEADASTLSILDGTMKTIFREALLRRQ